MKVALVLFIAQIWALSLAPSTQDIAFKITNIRNSKGNFVLCFFKDEAAYKSGQETIRREIPKKNIINKEINVSINLPNGTYGLVLLDDENLNDEMDYGLLMPKEGFGFSNYVPVISKPTFRDIDFQVSNSTKDPVVIKIKYM